MLSVSYKEILCVVTIQVKKNAIDVNCPMFLQQIDYSRIRTSILLSTKKEVIFPKPQFIRCSKWLNNKPKQFLLYCCVHVVFQLGFPALTITQFLWTLFNVTNLYLEGRFFAKHAQWQKQFNIIRAPGRDCPSL